MAAGPPRAIPNYSVTSGVRRGPETMRTARIQSTKIPGRGRCQVYDPSGPSLWGAMTRKAFLTKSLGPSTLAVEPIYPRLISPCAWLLLSPVNCHAMCFRMGSSCRPLVAISAQGGELSSAGGCQLLHPWSLVGEAQREIICRLHGPSLAHYPDQNPNTVV